MMEHPTSTFAKTVAERFYFLTQLYIFEVVFSTENSVRYESYAVFVNISHNKRDYTLDLGIGLRGSKDQSGFSFNYVIQLSDPQKAKEFRYPIAFSDTQIQEGLSLLAALLHQYGDLVLHGDSKAFEQMERFSEEYWAKRESDPEFRAQDDMLQKEFWQRYEKKWKEAQASIDG